MPRPAPALAVALIALAALAGCGDDEGSESAATTATSGASGATGAGGGGAEDERAMANARSAQTALESYAADHGGSYAGATPNDLDQIDPVTADIGVKTTAATYEVTAPSASGNAFTIARSGNGKVTRTCTDEGVGGCPENGEW